MSQKTRFLLAFASVWFISYIFFPTWSLPVSKSAKLIVALAFIFYISVNLIFLSKWLNQLPPLITHHSSLSLFTREHFLLIIAFAINFITHIYPMTLPIPTSGDQHYHSYAPLGILGRIDSICVKFFHIPFTQGISWILFIIFILLLLSKIRWQVKLKSLFVIAIIFSCVYVIAIIKLNVLGNLGELASHIHRYPPLGKITYLVWYSIVGVSEFKVRLISLASIYASAIYIYHLVRLFTGKFPATAASVLFIFFPTIFWYSHDLYLEPGTIFFAASASFYFLRYNLHRDFTDLVLTSFLIGTGFLYKETTLPMWGVCVIFGIILRKIPLRDTMMMGWFSIVPIIPWITITRLIMHLSPQIHQRPYFFTPHNFITPEILAAQFAILYTTITPAVCLITIIGFITLLAQKKYFLVLYFIIWFGVYYLFVTGDAFYSLIRFMIPTYPVLAILGAVGIDKLSKLHWRLPKVVLCLIITYLGITNCVASFKAFRWRFLDIQSYEPTIDSVYLPYDKLIEYVKKNIPKESKVLAPMICEPSHFYLELNGVFDKYTWYRKEWLPKEEQSMDNLYQFCKRANFGYFVTADAPLPEWTWLIKNGIIATLKNQADPRFALIKSWTLAGNTLFLYKVN